MRRAKRFILMPAAAAFTLVGGMTSASATPLLEFTVNDDDGSSGSLIVNSGDSDDNFDEEDNRVGFSDVIGFDSAGDLISETTANEEEIDTFSGIWNVSLETLEQSQDSNPPSSLITEGLEVIRLDNAAVDDTLAIEATADNLSNPSGDAVATTDITPSNVASGVELDFSSEVSEQTVLNQANLQGFRLNSEAVTLDAPYSVTHSSLFTVTSDTIEADGLTQFDANTSVEVPVPSTLALLGAGLIGLGVAVRRRATLSPAD